MIEVTFALQESQEVEIQTLDLLSQVMLRLLRTPGPHLNDNHHEAQERIALWFNSRYGKRRSLPPGNGAEG